MLKNRGLPSELAVISGSRNPHYNVSEARDKQTLKALFSRHQYGDAVDFIIDANDDERMDDLDRDGSVSFSDARFLADLLKTWERRRNAPGGIGIYDHHDVKNRTQSPYVHVDTRGYKARWSVR